MALVGNRSVLHKSPGRFLNGNATAGGAIGNLRSNFNKHGMSRNAFEVFAATSAQPYGYYGGQGAWVQPKIGGGVAGVNASVFTLSAVGAGTMGKNTSGTATVLFNLTGVGGLISSAIGVASFTLASSGQIFASKLTSGTASLSLNAAGQLVATGQLQGVGTLSFAASWAPYAVGWVAGTSAEAGLTPTGIANAVWTAVASLNNTAGSMGAKLNSAASGGVDYGDMSAAVRAELSAELLRIIELAKIHGLVSGVDLVVTPTSRTAGDVAQTITEAGSTVTVERA